MSNTQHSRPEHLAGLYIFYEGSPELGYVDQSQIEEFITAENAFLDEQQLFPTSDSFKSQRLARKVFKTIFFTSGVTGCTVEENGVYYGYHEDDALGTTVYEIGKRVISSDEECDAINLDYYSTLVGLSYGGWFLPRLELPRRQQATPIIRNFIFGRMIDVACRVDNQPVKC